MNDSNLSYLVEPASLVPPLAALCDADLPSVDSFACSARSVTLPSQVADTIDRMVEAYARFVRATAQERRFSNAPSDRAPGGSVGPATKT